MKCRGMCYNIAALLHVQLDKDQLECIQVFFCVCACDVYLQTFAVTDYIIVTFLPESK